MTDTEDRPIELNSNVCAMKRTGKVEGTLSFVDYSNGEPKTVKMKLNMSIFAASRRDQLMKACEYKNKEGFDDIDSNKFEMLMSRKLWD